MNWLAIVNEVFDVVWLLLLLWILWRLVRVSEKRQKTEATLADATMKNAESVRQSVETMSALVDLLKEHEK